MPPDRQNSSARCCWRLRLDSCLLVGATPVTTSPDDGAALQRTLEAAGLPPTAPGRFRAKAGWVSRAWIGDDVVVRLNRDPRHRDAYRHEAAVAGLLAGTDVPHARVLAHGNGPDGPWSVTERLPGRSLHEAWPSADRAERRSIVESLGRALRALHGVVVPDGLLPPWLAGALAGGPWPAFHPPVVGATLQLLEAARLRPEHDPRLLADVDAWVRERLELFASDTPVLVHGDLHGSNVVVDYGRVTGLVDFAEALAQPADAELDTLLRWCARPQLFPPTPTGHGLEAASLSEVPRWLCGAYPELFASEHLRERLAVYDLHGELALLAHHPRPWVREAAGHRLVRLLSGHSHLGRLSWWPHERP